MTTEVRMLTDDEIAELNLDQLVFEGATPVVNHLRTGKEETDRVGRPVITFDQFKVLDAMGARLDNYAMRMVGPTGTGTIQASKYLKFLGQGYLPVDVAERRAKAEQKVNERNPGEAVPIEAITIYRCSEKYPECPRFFDRPRARETHWGMEHENKLKKKKVRDA